MLFCWVFFICYPQHTVLHKSLITVSKTLCVHIYIYVYMHFSGQLCEGFVIVMLPYVSFDIFLQYSTSTLTFSNYTIACNCWIIFVDSNKPAIT